MSEVLLPYTLPQNEYMYGCVPTSVAAILGYYDKYGYLGYDVSNLIAGEISVYSRGTDGNKYDMDAFDTLLGNFTATQGHVDHFVGKTPLEEYSYLFTDGGEIDVASFSCLADWLGTSQYWRRMSDLATTYHFGTLHSLLTTTQTFTVSSDGRSKTLPICWNDFKYGLHRYVQSVGYALDPNKTLTVRADTDGGTFSFEDYMAEIDAGRPVLVALQTTGGIGHVVVGYGYDSETREIVFDDCYDSKCRMKWDGSYFYSDEVFQLVAISTIVFDTTGLPLMEEKEPVSAPTVNYITQALLLNSDINATVPQTEEFTDKKEIYLTATIANNGTNASPKEVYVAVYLDDALLRTITIPALAKGGSFTLSGINLGRLTVGEHTITVKADSSNLLLESKEDDNDRTETIQVVEGEDEYFIVSSSDNLVSHRSMSRIYLRDGGILRVSEEGVVSDSLVGQDGFIAVSSGGVCSDTRLSGGGSAVVSSRGTASNTTIESGGSMVVSSGGTATDTRLMSGGALVASEASLSHLTLMAGGVNSSLLSSGTTVTNLEVRRQSYIRASGAVLSHVLLDGMERYNLTGAYLYDGSVAEDVTLRRGLGMLVNDGAIVRDVLVEQHGTLEVAKGGVASDVTVLSKGYFRPGLILSSGATIHNLYLSGGEAQLLAGANINGRITLGGTLDVGGAVNANNADVGFLLTENQDSAIVSRRLNNLQGASYSILLNSKSDGVYLLAENLSSFEGNITVRNRFWDTNGVTLRVGDSNVSAWIYNLSLILDNGALRLRVEQDASLDTQAPVWNGALTTTQERHAVTINWNAATDNFFVDHYQVKVGDTLYETSERNFALSLRSGTHEIAVRAVDIAGNLSEWSQTKSVTVDIVDLEAPVFTRVPTCTVNENIATLQWQAMDNEAIDHYDIQMGYFSATLSGNADNFQGELYGTCDWTIRAVDEGGNITTRSGTVTAPAAEDGIVLMSGGNSTFLPSLCNDRNITSAQTLHVTRGGVALRPSVQNQGQIYAYSAGSASSATISSGGRIYVFNYGKMLDTVVESGGWALVSSGGFAEDTRIQSKGQMDVREEGIATDTVVSSGGSLIVLPDGIVRGLIVENGGFVYAYEGAIFDFDLREKSPEDALPIISGINEIKKSPTFTITVSADQKMGRYLLADCPTKDLSITIGEIDHTYGTLTMNGEVLRTSNRFYQLVSEAEAGLFLTVSPIPLAESPNVYADSITLTAGDVTLFVEENPAFAKVEYSFDKAHWTEYTNEGVSVHENGTVFFRSTDFEGFDSEIVGFMVENIDRDIEDPQPIADPIDPTNQDVVVSVAQNSDYVNLEVSLDNDTWEAYTGPIVFTENGTVWFRAEDEAGNRSNVVSYTVSNIDRTPPDAPVAMADVTEMTTRPVTVTATFSDDTMLAMYSFDGEDWQTYETGIVVTQNSTVWFRGMDIAGNFSEAVSYAVTNILPQVQPGEVITQTDFPAVGTIGGDVKSLTYGLALACAGKYTVSGDFPIQSGSITISNGKKKVASGTISKGVLKFNSNKPALLDAGVNYSVVVTSKDKTSADYSFTLQANTLFDKGDTSDDTIATAKPLALEEEWTDWSGYGDLMDYRAITLESGAKLTFDVHSSDAGTFALWQMVNGKAKSLQSTSLKANATTATKPLLLNAGQYYLSFASKNGAKGGSADYTVKLGQNSVFFTKGDNSDDTVATAKPFTLDEEWTDWVGMGDATDFRKLDLANGTKLVLDLKSSDAATFTIWQEDSKGKLKSLQATTLKANVAANNKPLLLNAGTYYLSFAAKNASKGGAADYTVKKNDATFFFVKGNNSDDTKETATAITFGEGWTDWVGMGDATDFRVLTLDSAAKLVFDLTSSDAATFNIWQENKGKLKSLQATTLKANVAAASKPLLLEAGTYYLSFAAKNAAKGGAADYTVAFNPASVLFPAATKNDDNWKSLADAPALVAGEAAQGWVGFGDTTDYFKFNHAENGTISLALDEATAADFRQKKLKITCLDAAGKSVALNALTADNQLLSKKASAAGDYFLCVTCGNPKQYDSLFSVMSN